MLLYKEGTEQKYNVIQLFIIQYILKPITPHRGFSGPMKHNQWNDITQQQQLLRTPGNWQEVNHKCGWEDEPGTTRNKFDEWSEQVLSPVTLDLKTITLTTGPHRLSAPHYFAERMLIKMRQANQLAGPHRENNDNNVQQIKINSQIYYWVS